MASLFRSHGSTGFDTSPIFYISERPVASASCVNMALMRGPLPTCDKQLLGMPSFFFESCWGHRAKVQWLGTRDVAAAWKTLIKLGAFVAYCNIIVTDRFDLSD